MRVSIWAALLICTASAPPAHSQAPAPVPGSTVSAEKRPISKALDFVGRVEAINRGEIRASVKGYLEAVLFKEGDVVKEGTPLDRIEKGLFNSAVDQAHGALETSNAPHESAVKPAKRQDEQIAKNAAA